MSRWMQYIAWRKVVSWLSQRFSNESQHYLINNTDWDILIVLDACRWDVLDTVATVPIEYCISPETSTPSWLREAEDSKIFSDTYIITANTNYLDFELGAKELDCISDEAWDHSIGNVPPEPVYETINEYIEKDKMPIVGHVLPPHAPYITKVGDSWITGLSDEDAWNSKNEDVSAQQRMATGKIDMERARKSYISSVKSTWESTEQYISDWIQEGYSVAVTADHGECFGKFEDWFMYEHPGGCHIKSLTRVPWEIFDQRDEPDNVPSTPKEQLRALGYTSNN